MIPRIVVLTGAGVSAESGLGTFRDADGLWTRYDLNDVATPRGFARDPGLVHAFYNARREVARRAAPNAAHAALTRLARAAPDRVTLVTQNIDDLHERAGCPDVIHMHGELMRALCNACAHRWPAPDMMDPKGICPACSAQATRPDVVWFGEVPYHMDLIEAALSKAEVFAAIGTSGQVYPAAGFVDLARHVGARTYDITLDPTSEPDRFDQRIPGPATETVPLWVDEILGEA